MGAIATGWMVLATALMVACGDDAAADPPGCARDDQCKGERICVEGACVDADGSSNSSGGGARDGGSDAGGANGSGGTSSSGSGGKGGTGGTNPTVPGLPPPAEIACLANCEARFAEPCYPADSPFTPEQCQSACLFLEESRQGYCLNEQQAIEECEERGGYTCSSERPVPNAACLVEREAMTTCTQETPCLKYCDDVEQECGDDRLACLDECLTDLTTLQRNCQSDYSRLLGCWEQQDICLDARGTSNLCREDTARVAWCLETWDDKCRGYCWAGDLLGCAPTDCRNLCVGRKIDSDCGRDWESLLRCMLSSNEFNLECANDALRNTIECKTERDTYDTCVLNAGP